MKPRQPTQNRRVVYRVERFPESLRALVDRGLAQGKSYRAIQQQVQEAGETITHHAIGRYWRYRWRKQHRWLHWVNAQADAMAHALRQTGESDEAVLARKLLFSVMLNRMEADVGNVKFPELLRESREMVKATRHLDSKSGAARPRLSREEMRRKVREIYGWPEEELDPERPPGALGTAKGNR